MIIFVYHNPIPDNLFVDASLTIRLKLKALLFNNIMNIINRVIGCDKNYHIQCTKQKIYVPYRKFRFQVTTLIALNRCWNVQFRFINFIRWQFHLSRLFANKSFIQIIIFHLVLYADNYHNFTFHFIFWKHIFTLLYAIYFFMLPFYTNFTQAASY